MSARTYAAALFLLLAGASGPSFAVAETPSVSAQPVGDAEPKGYLDRFNENMHAFNLWTWRNWEQQKPAFSLAQLAPDYAAYAPNVLSNLVNEPTAAVSWLIAGDYDNAKLSAWRFWVNTTQGWLGAVDVASDRGARPAHIDIGLALCARGVGEGGYIVLPIIGPRTVRDGLSDFLFTNAVTYAALSPIIGFPPSLETFALVEVVEEAARVAVVRQIDSADEKQRSLQDVRDEYLKARRERCDALTERLKKISTR